MRFLFLLFFPLALVAFEMDPWFTPLAEFQLRAAYSYRYYPSVDRAVNPTSYSSHDHIGDINLGVSPHPNWDVQAELNVAKTDRLSFGIQRVGLQGRYLWLNDVAGDPVSLTTGLSLFFVPTRNMDDVSSPYHAQGNAELGMAVGKEIDHVFDWICRFYAFLGAGIANRGSPWLRPLLSCQFQCRNTHRLQLFAEGYFGLGNRKQVNIRQFTGYAKLRHQSIDMGLNYTYHFDIWGDLSLQYAYRVFAKSFPEKASTFMIKYCLPFSIF
jgi:hypothetical protein